MRSGALFAACTVIWLSIACNVQPRGGQGTEAPSPAPAIAEVVPEDVVQIVRPMLDIRQQTLEECGAPGTPSKCIDGEAYDREQGRQKKYSDALYQLTQRKDRRCG